MGGGRGCLEAKQVVRRFNQVLRNQCRHMDKFVSRRIASFLRMSDFVSDCPLALDIVFASGGSLREYSLIGPVWMRMDIFLA